MAPLPGSASAGAVSATARTVAAAAALPLAPPGFSRSFYKRPLPCPPAIEFSSDEGKAVFAEAMAAGTMTSFFKLIEQFHTQDEPAYCGLASLSMVLNTLAIDPRRTWKGPWRWFHEEMLDCCLPLDRVRQEGVTLAQAACLARCNGARTEVFPFGAVSLAEFRSMVAASAAGGQEHVIVSYSRKAFGQTGDGHFSPIGGYSAARDLVLVLDTARFKYSPHWVPLEMMYSAMQAHDPTTGRPRGFLRLGRLPRRDSVLFTLDLRGQAWRDAHAFVLHGAAAAAAAAAAAPGATPEGVVAAVAAAAPAAALRILVAVRTACEASSGGVCVQASAIHALLQELRSTPLFAAVAAVLPAEGTPDEVLAATCAAAEQGADPEPALREDLSAERACMALLLVPADAWRGALPAAALRAGVERLLDVSKHNVVAQELEYLAAQAGQLQELEAALAEPQHAGGCGEAQQASTAAA